MKARSYILWGTIFSGIITAVAGLISSPKHLPDFFYAISSVIVFSVIGGIWYELDSRMKKVENRVNIWIHKDRENRGKWRQLAEQLEIIVDELNKKEDPTEGQVVLNGTLEVLKYNGLSYNELRTMMELLRKCTKFRGIAIYGPGEWMDPLWFAYLIAQAAFLKGHKDTKRFFIYSKDIINSPGWNDRLRAIVDAIGQSIPAHVCIVEKVEERLKSCSELKDFLKKLYSDYNKGQNWEEPSFIPLMDIIYIEIEDKNSGKKTHKCKWRNPSKAGEVEDLLESEAQSLGEKLQPIYEELEKIAEFSSKPEVS